MVKSAMIFSYYPPALLAFAFVAMGGLTACAATAETRSLVDDAIERSQELLTQDNIYKPALNVPVIVDDGVYLSAHTLPRRLSKVLPREWASREVVYQSNVGEGIESVFSYLGSLTGFAFRLQESETGGGQSTSIILEHEGTLRNLLDKVAAQINGEWQYKNGVVLFLTERTAIFTLRIPPAVITTSQGASGGESSISSSGNYDVWTDITTRIEQILDSHGGGTATPLQAAGEIIVTASPRALDEAGDFVSNQNRLLGRQVSLDVELLSVRVGDADNYSFSLGAILNGLGIGLGNPAAGTSAATPLPKR